MREEFLKDCVVGKHVGGTAGEEFSGWDINFTERFFGREGLVGRMKLVLLLLFTNSSHCEVGVKNKRGGCK